MSVKSDIIQNVSIHEQFGEIVEAVNRHKVTIPKTGGQGLFFRALAEAGVPQPGESLNSDYEDVRVEERSIDGIPSIGQSEATVFVDVVYRLQRPETDQGFPVRGGSSLQQIVTQVDREGLPIEVEYNDNKKRAELSVLSPNGNHMRNITIATNSPDNIVAEWINTVNSSPWRGKGAGHWLVQSVMYEIVDRNASPKKYRFDFEFEQASSPDGWTYTVAYKDENGDIPQDIIDGVGIVDVIWHPEKDFTTLFT